MTLSEQIFTYRELKKDGQALFVCDYVDADRIIAGLELLEKQEKYRWHDLRKNPEDLPEERDSIFAKHYNTEKWHKSFFRTVSDEVIVCFEAPSGERIEKMVQSHDGQFNFPYTGLKTMKAIAWRYIEPFEEGDTE